MNIETEGGTSLQTEGLVQIETEGAVGSVVLGRRSSIRVPQISTGLRRISAAATEPVTLAELKLQCRVDTTDDDLLLGMFIAAARAKAENYTGTALITQTWEQTLDAFPPAQIELLRPPVATITSVTYVDELGATQTLSSSLYTLDASTYPGWLLPAFNTEWPDTQDSANAVTIRYVSGGASAPDDVKAWILMTAAFMYTQREAMVLGGKIAEIPARFIDSLLDPYRVYKF